MMSKNTLLAAGLLLLCLCQTADLCAQKKPKDKYRHRATKDTLVIELNERDRLAIPVKTVYQFELESVNDLLVQLNRDLGAAPDSLTAADGPVTVLYLEETDGERRLQVTTKPTEQSEMYYMRETGVIRRRTSPDSIIVQRANKQKLFFTLESIKSLKQLENRNVDSVLTKFKEVIATHGQLQAMKDAWVPYGGWLTVIYRLWVQPSEEYMRVGVYTHEDFGFVGVVGTGVGLVRDKVAPELGIGLGYRFPRTKTYVGLKFAMLYFFNRRSDESYAMNINSFLSVDLGEVKGGNALSIGYLIHRSGGYFNGTTFKISQTVGAGKLGKLRLIPELFITNNLTVFFPGIRLGLMF